MLAQIPMEELRVNTHVFPEETTRLVVNSNLLLAGESLFYKVDNLTASKTKSNLSKIVYVALKSEKDSVVFSHKLKLDNGMAQADFFIPAILKTGKYNLIAYTNFSKNNTENMFSEEEIYVINSFQSNNLDVAKDDLNITRIEAATPLKNKGEMTASGVTIETNASTYSKRDLVSLNINNTLETAGYGNYSISVRKMNGVQVIKTNETVSTSFTNDKQLFFIPELRGELISGKIEALNSNVSVENIAIGLTIPGTDFIFKIAKTNASGRFFFSVDESYQTANCLLQIEAVNKKDYRLILDSKEISIKGANNKKEVVVLDKSIETWLAQRSVELQIENAYFNSDNSQFKTQAPNPPFFGNLGTEYILDEYTRFPSVEETFVEVITLAGTRKFGEATRFVVFDAYDPEGKAQFSSFAPLLLVDGMLVQDASQILGYDSAKIKSIRVLAEAYRYGARIYSGIIAFTTIKGDFKPNLNGDFMSTFELQGLIAPKQIHWPNYAADSSSRIPDYRNQLYWNPIVSVSANSEIQTFYTSDIMGSFEVILEGYTNDGNYITSKQYFTVE